MKFIKGFWILKFSLFAFMTQGQEPLNSITYDPDIKTIQLYPYTQSSAHSDLSPAIFSLNSSQQWILEFDDLRASYRQFHVKILHCDLDWKLSRLRDLEYLTDYNDFIINDYHVSQGTKKPYYHYGFQLPKTKLSGNYILELYENDLYGEPLLRRRFRVVEALVGVSAEVQIPQDPSMWRTHQQVNFEIAHPAYEVRNPRTDFHIEIRQNFRDETIRSGFEASSVNNSRNTLAYRFFKNENLFEAGNEFRRLDIRSTYTSGTNVQETQQGYEDHVFVRVQSPRSNLTYLSSPDLNGQYIIETQEDGHPASTADYVNVHFKIESIEHPDYQKVCVLGGFNNYQCTNSAEMAYDYNQGVYQTNIALKQGVYDFQFAIEEKPQPLDFKFFEGNFSDTGNTYEVFVYHQPPSARAPMLVGYTIVNAVN
ncbi:type IX secretion system plug protein [Jiulongibacter sp. NS-SX5]|uniref:type IX secretion system plug protein n=1 Tax=Jiulongibacter sp. NS-SX5 TaxID=3463854 RepID=UPI004057FF4B